MTENYTNILSTVALVLPIFLCYLVRTQKNDDFEKELIKTIHDEGERTELEIAAIEMEAKRERLRDQRRCYQCKNMKTIHIMPNEADDPPIIRLE